MTNCSETDAVCTQGRKPDFVCIGPEKTATSWLYSVLSRHPQVWLPPIKELRFLSEGFGIPPHTVGRVLLSTHWHYRTVRKSLRRAARGLVSSFGSRGQAWWMLRYAFLPHSFAWYDSLFVRNGSVCGDITPVYYDLPEVQAAALAEHNPETRILIFVRDPVARVWSKALMNLCKQPGRKYEDVPPEEFRAFFETVFEQWTPYAEVVARYRRHFRHVFVGHFDDLRQDPRRFFHSVCEFLNICPETAIPELERRVNVGSGERLEKQYEAFLFNQYRAEIDEMAASDFSPHAADWLSRRCRSISGCPGAPKRAS